jgi:hypothetical protein
MLEIVYPQVGCFALRHAAEVAGDLELARVRGGDDRAELGAVICMYALNDVAPSPAQYSTICRAVGDIAECLDLRDGKAGPFRYGGRDVDIGTGQEAGSMFRLRLMSA